MNLSKWRSIFEFLRENDQIYTLGSNFEFWVAAVRHVGQLMLVVDDVPCAVIWHPNISLRDRVFKGIRRALVLLTSIFQLWETFLQSSYVLCLLDDQNIWLLLVDRFEWLLFELVLHLCLCSPPLGSWLQKMGSITFLGCAYMTC